MSKLKEIQDKILSELISKSPVKPPSWVSEHLKDADFKGCTITEVGFIGVVPLKVTRVIFDTPIIIKGDL